MVDLTVANQTVTLSVTTHIHSLLQACIHTDLRVNKSNSNKVNNQFYSVLEKPKWEFHLYSTVCMHKQPVFTVC